MTRFYNEIFTAIHECVVSLSVKHDNQFARGMVASFPFLTQYVEDYQETERRWEGLSHPTSNQSTPSQFASQSQLVPPVPNSFRAPRSPTSFSPDSPSKGNQDPCSIMVVEGAEEGGDSELGGKTIWVDDSGASESQSPHQESFVRMRLEPQKFRIAKGSLRTDYKGKVQMHMSGAHGEEVCVYDSHTTLL